MVMLNDKDKRGYGWGRERLSADARQLISFSIVFGCLISSLGSITQTFSWQPGTETPTGSKQWQLYPTRATYVHMCGVLNMALFEMYWDCRAIYVYHILRFIWVFNFRAFVPLTQAFNQPLGTETQVSNKGVKV